LLILALPSDVHAGRQAFVGKMPSLDRFYFTGWRFNTAELAALWIALVALPASFYRGIGPLRILAR